MTVYSYAQLEQLWINAGGATSLAPVAAAIAEAESGGNSAAENKTDNNGTQTSWGLWQISNGTHNQPVPNILDPNVNAQQAVAKYKGAGNSFSPWGTYTSGAYLAHLSNGTTPDQNVPAGTGTTPTATLTAAQSQAAADCLIGGGEGGVFGIGSLSFCLLNKTEARAVIGGACVAGGLAIMGLGLAFVAVFALGRSGVAQTVVNLTPAGRVTRTVQQRPQPSPQPNPAPQPEPARS